MDRAKRKRGIITIAIVSILSVGLYIQLYRLGYVPTVRDLLDIVRSKDRNIKVALPKVEQGKLLNYDKTIEEIIATESIDRSKSAIAIEKSKYRLTLYYEGKAIKSYPVVFGKNPTGNKLREGDYKTPVGEFKIRDLYPHQSWSKFIWIDYPNHDSWKKHYRAKQEGKINWNDSIGGEIGIHGVPEGADYLIDKRKNWTLGCISLKNKDVDEIYKIVQIGTTIEIIP